MPAYTNNLRLREITTGDESGTWGDTTNSNLELIADAFGTGTEGLSGTTHTTEIADSPTADEGRALYLKYTGALGANNTVTLAPNDVNKLWIIENATTDSGSTGPYSIIIKQGTGDTVTIPNGKVAVVYADGAGSAADVKEAFANLKIGPSLTVGNAAAEDTKIVFDGNAQDYYVGLDDTDDDLKIGLGSTVGTTPAITIDENQNTTISQDLTVSGVGPHAFGAAVVNNVRFSVAGAFTSGGVSDYATGFGASAAITGAVGDTVALAGAIFQNTLTTQGTDTNISRVAQVMINEPQISNNLASSGKPDVAASLWIQNAPTEGDVNAALYVADGLSHFAGNIEVAKSAAKIILDSSSAASVDIDRSATSENATVDFQTAGSSNWSIGLRDSDDWGDGTSFMMGTGSSAANTKFALNTSGVLTLGTVTPDVLYTLTPRLQVETTGSDAGLSAWRNSNDAGGAYLFLGSSRGTSVNSDTIVQDDDTLGSIMFMAADGTDRGNAAASILANIDGTPGGNDTPGRLTFNTSADGSGAPTTRMTILSDGKIGIGANLSKEVNFSNGPNTIQNCLHFEASTDVKWGIFAYDRSNSHYCDVSIGANLIYTDESATRVGINTSSPDAMLHVKDGDTVIAPNSSADNFVVSQKTGDVGISIMSGNANCIIAFGDEASADDGAINYIHSSRLMRFKAADTSFFWIASDGFYLGAATGDNQFRTSSAGSGSTTMYIGNQSITTSSDRRLKTNIVDSSLDAVDALNQLRVTEFNWDDPNDTSHNNRNARGTWTGMIAQEVVEHLPFTVNAPRDENKVIDYDSDSTWSIEPMALCGVLVKAIQELSTRIEDLEAQLNG